MSETERESWTSLRDRRMSEPGAQEAYETARLAYELGVRVRELRQARGWSQSDLASAAEMTQPAVARLEAGGTVPTLGVLRRVARALGAGLAVEIRTGKNVA